MAGMKKPCTRRRLAAAALAVAPAVLLLAGNEPAGAAVRSRARVRPDVLGCEPSEEFIRSSKSERFYGTGAIAWVYNYNTTGLSKTLTTSTANTIGFSLQAS